MLQNSAHKLPVIILTIFALYRHVNMHPVSCIFFHRFWRKISAKPIPHCRCSHDPFKRRCVVSSAQSIAVLKINLILPRSFLMVRSFRLDSHINQCKTDLPPYIFPFILRRNIHISCMIKWNSGRSSLFVCLKQIKLYFCAKVNRQAFLFRLLYSLLQNVSAVLFI